VGWVVLGVWLGAVLFAALLLGFCALELTWKSRSVRNDLTRLQQDAHTLAGMQAEIALLRERVAASQRLATTRGGG
jgi:hypothetical protein